MNTRRTRRSTTVAAVALLATAPLLVTIPAQAAESDISVTYTTQNADPAPIDGSYTVHGRVGQTRDDMKVVYTIQTDAVAYPMPVIDYTGDFTDTADAVYTFRFDCDTAVDPVACARYAPIVAAMNAEAEALDGRSIADFTTDVAPIIQQYGGSVPRGIRGTVTVSVNSDVPGTGQLSFYLQEGSDADAVHLSPTVVTPLSITRPELTLAGAGEFCAADLTEYVADGYRYTPTEFGRDAFALTAGVTDAGILPDDVTAVGTDPALITVSVNGGTAGTAAAAQDAVLDAAAGSTTTLVADYTAPDGVAALPVLTSVSVLAESDTRCWTRTAVTGPTPTPTPTSTSTPTPTPTPTPTSTSTPTPTSTSTPTPTPTSTSTPTPTPTATATTTPQPTTSTQVPTNAPSVTVSVGPKLPQTGSGDNTGAAAAGIGAIALGVLIAAVAAARRRTARS